MQLDALDLRLLDALSEDGRASTQSLCDLTGLSRSAVFHRVKRLERDGVIKGYCARLDRSKLGLEIRAFCNVSLQQHAAGFLEEFEAAIANFREVRSCFHIAGRWNQGCVPPGVRSTTSLHAVENCASSSRRDTRCSNDLTTVSRSMATALIV